MAENSRRYSVQSNSVFHFRMIVTFMVVLALCTLPTFILLGCNSENLQAENTSEEIVIPSIVIPDVLPTGLPVNLRDDSTWPFRGWSSSHTAVDQLSRFFIWQINYSSSRIDLFAFVEILGTEQQTDYEWYWPHLQQYSTVQILLPLWSKDVEIPETITLVQSFFGYEIAADDPTILREGGVYLLPLNRWSGNDGDNEIWTIREPFDVLFEVDDEGRIWSHSPHESFNHFDGEDARVVVDAILDIIFDENFAIATTSYFATWAGMGWPSLVEFTVLSSTRPRFNEEGFTDMHHYHLVLNIEDVLLTSRYEPWPNLGEEVFAKVHHTMPLEEGQRYLAFIAHCFGSSFILDSRTIAKIHPDRTIEAVDAADIRGWYSLGAYHAEPFNGLTVEQMREIVERARAWYDIHVR